MAKCIKWQIKYSLLCQFTMYNYVTFKLNFKGILTLRRALICLEPTQKLWLKTFFVFYTDRTPFCSELLFLATKV